jgi:hypothetical protein
MVLGRHQAYQTGEVALLDTAQHPPVASDEGVGSRSERLPASSLDGKRTSPPTCERVRLVNRSTGEIRGVWCKSWYCDRCAPRRLRQARRHIGLGLEEDGGAERPKFLTLTSRPGELPHESTSLLTDRFANLRRHLQRCFPSASVEYAGVPERTRAGALHLHVILRGVPFMPQPVWSRLAERFGFGRIVWIAAVTGERGMTSYLTKSLGGYMTKDLGRHRWPPGFHRLRFSQGWALGWVSYRAAGPGQPSAQEDSWLFLRVDPPPREGRTDDQSRAGP